jgi:hypothetical protein
LIPSEEDKNTKSLELQEMVGYAGCNCTLARSSNSMKPKDIVTL